MDQPEGVNPVMATAVKPIADRPDPEWLGSMREDAELLDEIVQDAMRRRRLQAWCPSPDDFAALELIAEETGRSLDQLLDEALHLLLERRGRQQPRREEGPGRGG